ncbi:MAG: hypothetical protein CM15mV121_080 [uncultured marine virus]|nr:MAG: hypothetical protein CM15mV121_080 [uncultured marine virus]
MRYMRYKYKVRELGKETVGKETEDMEAMSLKKLRRKLDHKKEYAIEYTNKHNNFISTTTRGIEPK